MRRPWTQSELLGRWTSLVGDETLASLSKLERAGVPRSVAVTGIFNAALRQLLLAGVSPDTVRIMLEDSLEIIRHHAIIGSPDEAW